MPCRGSGDRGESLGARQWENWAGTLRFRPLQTFRPATLEQLVAIVGDAHDRRLRARAVGSSWSYSEVAVSGNVQVVVETDRLRRVLSGDAASPDAIVPAALNAQAARDARHLVHVEAGIKLEELNCILDERRLAMSTLGSDVGQSLLGVISTATHGADIALPPVADAVEAIHLVGPGGREWWIERAAGRAITDRSRMEDLRRRGRLCADLILEYDDTTFNAVLVSMGRLGIVYSVVLRVRDAFRLRETRETRQWSELERTLRGPGPEAPVRGFNSPAVEIAFNPYRNGRGDHDCVLTLRGPAEPTGADLPRGDADLPFTLLCGSRNLAGTIRPMLVAVDAAAAVTFGFLLLIPFAGPVAFAVATTAFVTLRVALEGLLASLGSDTDLAQALARVCNLAAVTGQSWIVRDLVGAMVAQVRGPLPGGHVTDKSFKVMTSQAGCENLGQAKPQCMRQIDGMEIAFDARAGQHGYIDFVNGVGNLVEELLRRNRPVGVALSLRYSGRSQALLAMQQFDTNCSIEVIILRGLPGNDEFVRRLETLAYDRGGIPHWGLIHNVTRAQVNRFYGERLTTWRQVLARMVERSGGRVDTFSTTFSVEHDLEPLPSCTLPPAVGNFLVRVLRALAEALARRRSGSAGGQRGGAGQDGGKPGRDDMAAGGEEPGGDDKAGGIDMAARGEEPGGDDKAAGGKEPGGDDKAAGGGGRGDD